MTIVINLFGSSGSGKSTTAMGLAYKLKTLGFKVELVSEWIKEQIHAKNLNVVDDQLYIFAKQRKKQRILIGKGLDFIVTDSPLLLSNFYGEKYKSASPIMNNLFIDEFNSFNNLNFFLNRTVPFDPMGRFETEEQSNLDSKNMIEFLKDRKIPYSLIDEKEKTLQIINLLNTLGHIKHD